MSFRISDLAITFKIVDTDQARLALEGCGEEVSVEAVLLSCEDTNQDNPQPREEENFRCGMGTTADLRELQRVLREMSDKLEPIARKLEEQEAQGER